MHSAESGVAPEAVAEAYHNFEQGGNIAPLKAAAISNQSIQESMRLLLLVRAYQVHLKQLCCPVHHASCTMEHTDIQHHVATEHLNGSQFSCAASDMHAACCQHCSMLWLRADFL